MRKIVTLTVILIALFASCSDKKEDVVKQPSKDGSVEVIMTTIHAKGFDILNSNYKIWVKGTLTKTICVVDTLPSLGVTSQEVSEDEDGNAKYANIPRDYEFYITVK